MSTNDVDVLKLDEFTRAYIVCALWSSHKIDEKGNVLGNLDEDHEIEDLSAETLATIVRDCKDFQEEHAELLARAGSAEQNGHDFWLTRNGHGAGFWDRGYPQEVGTGLSKAARLCGSCDLYVGDDGKVRREDEASQMAGLELERGASEGFESDNDLGHSR